MKHAGVQRTVSLLVGLSVAGIGVICLPPEAVAQERVGRFTVQVDTDPITDEFVGVASTESAERTALGERGTLAWGCRGSEPDLWIDANDFLITGGGGVAVDWRVDDNEPHSGRWLASADGTVALVRNELTILIFTAEALTGLRMTTRLRDYRGVAHTFTFNLVGLSRSLDRLPCWEDLLEDISQMDIGLGRMMLDGITAPHLVVVAPQHRRASWRRFTSG